MVKELHRRFFKVAKAGADLPQWGKRAGAAAI